MSELSTDGETEMFLRTLDWLAEKYDGQQTHAYYRDIFAEAAERLRAALKAREAGYA